MARIRTVKPEIWTDENFIELSPHARLMLIALLNFATDHGVLPDKPKTLKMQCLPADDVNAEALIEECVSAHFLLREVAPDGSKVLVIRTFKDHQRINRKTDGRWGDPEMWVKSVTTHGVLTEDSHTEGKGREWKGSITTCTSSSQTSPSGRVDTYKRPVDKSEEGEGKSKTLSKPKIIDIAGAFRTVTEAAS